jgi:hypothetical protein
VQQLFRWCGKRVNEAASVTGVQGEAVPAECRRDIYRKPARLTAQRATAYRRGQIFHLGLHQVLMTILAK